MLINSISMRGVSMRGVSMRGISMEGRGERAKDFEGYPLIIDINQAKSTRDYIIYGNTDAEAQGVGRKLDQVLVDNLPEISSRGYRFGIKERTLSVHGIRTQEGEIVSKIGNVKAGHTYLCVFFSANENINIQLYTSGHDIIYIPYSQYKFTPAFDMDAYIQIARTRGVGYSIDGAYRAPRLYDLTELGIDVANAEQLAERLGEPISKVAYDFPYGSSFVAPIRVGSRNLWDGSDFDNWYLPSGSSVKRKRLKLAPNTEYTLSVNEDRGSGSSWLFIISGSNLDFSPSSLNNGLLVSNGLKRTVTSDANGNIVVAAWADMNDSVLPMLELGATASPYEPYSATLYPSVLSSPLHKIGDIVDYKESNGKEWHGLKEIVLDGNSDIKQTAGATGGAVALFTFSNTDIPHNATAKIVSSYLPTTSQDGLYLRLENGISVWTWGNMFCFRISQDIDTIAKAKAYLAEHPLRVVYELATPTEVQGEPLPRLAIPKGESIVTLDTAVEPSNITAKI